ncbi:hypothetical protein MED222_05805 [Vibrio sp. MED222]|nr:hypothetical protein MED222_05805 [Vibrio sp. MED222]
MSLCLDHDHIDIDHTQDEVSHEHQGQSTQLPLLKLACVPMLQRDR